jgi:hypothetical protein
MERCLVALFLSVSILNAVIVDQIAIIVGNGIIKDSDIIEDLRINAFLNHEAVSVTRAARKEAGNRLIDQTLIRKEIESGDYPSGSVADEQTLLSDVKKKYPDDASYQKALAARGIDEPDVKKRLLWQLSVLRFIDSRFRPAVLVTDQDIDMYIREHRQQLRTATPGKSAEEVRSQAEDFLVGERVNQLLEKWLDRRRKATKIVYLEDALK